MASIVVGMSSEDIAALTTTQVSVLGTADINVLSTVQVQGLTTAQVSVLTTAQVSAGLTSSQLGVLSLPLAVDVQRQAVFFANNGIMFRVLKYLAFPCKLPQTAAPR